jgi:hypothetical protein
MNRCTHRIDGHVIDGDAPFGQQLLHLAIREPVAQIPSHRHHDLRREPDTSEARPRRGDSGRARPHQPSLPARRGDPPRTVPTQVRTTAARRAQAQLTEPDH